MPVYAKPDGRIFCVYYNGRQRVWEPFGRGDDARAAAEVRDLEIKLKKKRGQWQAMAPVNPLTFEDLTQSYIDAKSRELSRNSRQGILYTYKTYARPVIGNKPLTSITLDDWQKIQQGMIQRKIKNRTINTYFKYLSGILTWAIEENEDLLHEHPWHKRKPLKVRDSFKVELFTVEEFQGILAHAEPHLAWCLDLAYHTGVRPGPTELFSLMWSHIDWEKKRIQIPSTKTSNLFRWQYPDPGFMKRLRAKEKKMQKGYPDCPYICSYKGRQIKSLKTAWRTAKEKAGITRRIRLYDIRHFFITYALAGGAPINELAERVGHINPRMIVEVYSHLAQDLKERRAFSLPKLITKRSCGRHSPQNLKTVDKTVDKRKGRPKKTA